MSELIFLDSDLLHFLWFIKNSRYNVSSGMPRIYIYWSNLKNLPKYGINKVFLIDNWSEPTRADDLADTLPQIHFFINFDFKYFTHTYYASASCFATLFSCFSVISAATDACSDLWEGLCATHGKVGRSHSRVSPVNLNDCRYKSPLTAPLWCYFNPVWV